MLYDGEWFEEISPAALYESDFERLVIENAASLYPNYIAVRFKAKVASEDGSAEADMALVSRGYEEWWVVEIELAQHSLSGHVLPQVRRLARARYGAPEARALCAETTVLDPVRTEDMMKGKQPRVLVIANAPCPDWILPLSKWEACVAIVQLYISDKNRRILRVNGEHPSARVEQMAKCYFENRLPLLLVDTPAILPQTPDGRIRIRYENNLTEWKRTPIKDRVLLVPVGANPLDIRRSYELVQHADGSLMFREMMP